MTNKEKIQSMSDTELAMFLNLGIEDFIEVQESEEYPDCILKWLKMEYKPTIKITNVFTKKQIEL